MKVYSNEEYRKAHVELLEILKYIPPEDKNKIPREYIEFCNQDRDTSYEFKYDIDIDFENQDIMELTKILIANVYIKYWATAERKKEIKKTFIDEQLRNEKIYNYNNLFPKTEKVEIVDYEEKNLVPVKKNFIKRIIGKIKEILRLT